MQSSEAPVKCWTFPANSTVPEAAGVIHSDFECGFIKADVVAYDDFKELCDNKMSMACLEFLVVSLPSEWMPSICLTVYLLETFLWNMNIK